MISGSLGQISDGSNNCHSSASNFALQAFQT